MDVSNITIGILGGSFNPAHEGHVHLSLEAIEILNLAEIWWYVSPANPLKSKSDLEDYAKRLDFARHLTRDIPKIIVSDFEADHGLEYTVDTMRLTKQYFSAYKFIWLMGADNLESFHLWHQWEALIQENLIAVFDREPYTDNALMSTMAEKYAAARIPEDEIELFKAMEAPAWTYVQMPTHPESSTRLRKTLGKDAFMIHNEYSE